MPSSPIVVVGLCSSERRRYAAALATAIGRAVVRVSDPTSGAASGSAPQPTPVRIARTRNEIDSVVLDVDADVDALHLEPCLRRPAPDVICVVDAPHLLDDLRDRSRLVSGAGPGDDRGDVGARARRGASQIETASHVCIVNWERLETARLSVLMSLLAHLAPTARVRLSRGAAEDLDALRGGGRASAGDAADEILERAGWVRALNDEHDPYLTDRRVTTERYERLRPFHPARLVAALDALDAGRAGRVVRSAGFCRIASRARTLARWDQVGPAIWIDPLDADMESSLTAQDLAFTGVDLMPGAVARLLDEALVTDAELAAGPQAWATWADPLPVWAEEDVLDHDPHGRDGDGH